LPWDEKYGDLLELGVGLATGFGRLGRTANHAFQQGMKLSPRVTHAMAQPLVSFGVHKVIGNLASEATDTRASAWAQQRGWKACFAAGTPLRTPEGSRNIEDVRVGDLVLSRDEHNPDGLVVAQTVEEVFVRQGLIWHLHLGGQVIRTTAEHPFYREGDGWTACQELRVGDRLLTEDGTWVTVEDLLDTGEWETVYNLRVAEFHTYFVGCDEWGFAVWAHNADADYVAHLATITSVDPAALAKLNSKLIPRIALGTIGPIELQKILMNKGGVSATEAAELALIASLKDATNGVPKVIDQLRDLADLVSGVRLGVGAIPGGDRVFLAAVRARLSKGGAELDATLFSKNMHGLNGITGPEQLHEALLLSYPGRYVGASAHPVFPTQTRTHPLPSYRNSRYGPDSATHGETNVMQELATIVRTRFGQDLVGLEGSVLLYLSTGSSGKGRIKFPCPTTCTGVAELSQGLYGNAKIGIIGERGGEMQMFAFPNRATFADVQDGRLIFPGTAWRSPR
jgi:hypothetical protein